MIEELSSADRSSLAAERGPINMTVGGLTVFEANDTLTRAAMMERLGERIHLLPRLRHRLEVPPFGIATPVWGDDVDFDPEWHVRQASIPAPGGEREIAQIMGREFSNRLDRSRPLWDFTLVEGLAGGRKAILMRAHHALADGVATARIAAMLLDLTPEPYVPPPPDQEWSPTAFKRTQHVTRLVTKPVTGAARPVIGGLSRAIEPDPRRAVAGARRAAGDVRAAADIAMEIAGQRPQAPMTPLNQPISSNRRYASAEIDLATLKRVAKLADAKVNDVILGAITQMLRSFLSAPRANGRRPQLIGREPVALVPVSIRSDADGDFGNRISTVLIDLPVQEPDLLDQIHLVHAQTIRAKQPTSVRVGSMMIDASGFAPPLIAGVFARAVGAVRTFNIVVSNVTGPPMPVYFRGIKADAMYPVVPLNPSNQGMTVGVVSYNNNVFFGLLADRDLDPPLQAAHEGLRQALADLHRL